MQTASLPALISFFKMLKYFALSYLEPISENGLKLIAISSSPFFPKSCSPYCSGSARFFFSSVKNASSRSLLELETSLPCLARSYRSLNSSPPKKVGMFFSFLKKLENFFITTLSNLPPQQNRFPEIFLGSMRMGSSNILPS